MNEMGIATELLLEWCQQEKEGMRMEIIDRIDRLLQADRHGLCKDLNWELKSSVWQKMKGMDKPLIKDKVMEDVRNINIKYSIKHSHLLDEDRELMDMKDEERIKTNG